MKGIHAEFNVDATVLQVYQHLIQFVTNLALHVLASVPEYKHRPGPGVSPSIYLPMLHLQIGISKDTTIARLTFHF